MIRTGYVDEDGDGDGQPSVNTITAVTRGTAGVKRKSCDDNTRTSKMLQDMEIITVDDSEDEDILIVNIDDDDDLRVENESKTTTENKLPSVESETEEAQLATGPCSVNVQGKPDDSDDDDSEEQCHMKWLRTVGMDHQGRLKCTVANSTDNLSICGKPESLMADSIKGMLNMYQKRRSEVVDDNGIVSTPLHIVKKLAKEHGETLHFEKMSFQGNLYHRVELMTGILRGIGEGPTKRLAEQLAAVDVLEKVQLAGSAVKVPPLAFLPGWLTDNKVFPDLFALQKKKNLPRLKFVVQRNADTSGVCDPSKAPFRVECWIGTDMVTIGESENEQLAKKEAAKEMFQLISNVEYQDAPYAIGEFCHKAKEIAKFAKPPIMSSQKKKWLLENRVIKNELVFPPEEMDIENCNLKELEDDIDEADVFSLHVLKKRNIQVSLRNEKRIISETNDQLSTSTASPTAGCSRE